jgi:hypothetical protein
MLINIFFPGADPPAEKGSLLDARVIRDGGTAIAVFYDIMLIS